MASLLLDNEIINNQKRQEIAESKNREEYKIKKEDTKKQRGELTSNDKNKNDDSQIVKIAAVEEIKNPFSDHKRKDNDKSNNKENIVKFDSQNNILALEKNIMTAELIKNNHQKDNNSTKLLENHKEIDKTDKNKSNPEEIKISNENKERVINLNKNNLVFELRGIIKNSNNSSALFFYQGENILKKENEKIDIFKIEKIMKNKVILGWQKKKIEIKLWEAE